MIYSIDELSNATGYEKSAYEFARNLPSCPYGIYGPDFIDDGLWLPIEDVWAGDSYGCGPLEVIMKETNEAAALKIIDGYDEPVEREYHGGYWFVQVVDSEGVVNDTARGVLDEIAEALVNYPLLDESTFNEREWEETSEALPDAVKDELRDAAPAERDEWEDIADTAGVDLVEAILNESPEFESEDCWPRFKEGLILEIAAGIIDELKATNAAAAARAAHVEKYGDDPAQKVLFK